MNWNSSDTKNYASLRTNNPSVNLPKLMEEDGEGKLKGSTQDHRRSDSRSSLNSDDSEKFLGTIEL